MAKVMNVVFGIAIAVIIFIVVLLGIRAFYSEPTYERYNCTYPDVKPYYGCTDNMTIAQCNALQASQSNTNTIEQKAYDECSKQYETANKNYRTIVFFIVYILGIIALIASMFLLYMTNIAAGVSFAGIVLIFYGFTESWGTTNDILKFITGLVAAAVIIVFAVIINKKYSK
ncbi:MAG: hypothetical protein AABX11_01480 [Nanoarchaeota archaeon]